MSVILVTGSSGLIGSESVRFFYNKGFEIIGIDNNLRKFFFGDGASTYWNLQQLMKDIPTYKHNDIDIRNFEKLEKIFEHYSNKIALIIHCAAQPSHDWAAKDPFTDFSVNANGTLNLLELTRKYCPDAAFIFTSTNKVYGDTPNNLPLKELEQRYEIDDGHKYCNGIDETMSIDYSKHSLFGASKLSADILVQEYGRYFDMKTVCFRCGCLTGPKHSGAEQHGFLSYLIKCNITNKRYSIFGYNGKQVRDNIHSFDLVNAFWHYYQNPRIAEVYNIGGARFSNCSMLEAISICESITKKPTDFIYKEVSRIGDHIWWISDMSKFISHYPNWQLSYSINHIIKEICEQHL